MKRSIKIRVTCLVVAAMVLAGAVTVAAVLGSPYETLKNAVFDALAYRNATVEGEVTLTVDGEVLETTKINYINGDDASLQYFFDEDGNQNGFRYTSDGLNIYPSHESDGKSWYWANVYPPNEWHDGKHFRANGDHGFAVFNEVNRNSAQVRFIELAIDALVGDLKNNITMTAENGGRLVSGTLTENQVPELVKAGIDMLVEQANDYYSDNRDISFDGREYIYENVVIKRETKTVSRWKNTVRSMTDEEHEAWLDGTIYLRMGDFDRWGVVYIEDSLYILTEPSELIDEYTAPVTRADFEVFEDRDPWSLPVKSVVINYMHMEAKIDADGNLQAVDVSGTATVTDIFGDTHIFEIKGTVRFTDIGTSKPVCPIPGAEQLLTPENMKIRLRADSMRNVVYFTLNEDGSIDADSITANYLVDTGSNGPMTFEKAQQAEDMTEAMRQYRIGLEKQVLLYENDEINEYIDADYDE